MGETTGTRALANNTIVNDGDGSLQLPPLSLVRATLGQDPISFERFYVYLTTSAPLRNSWERAKECTGKMCDALVQKELVVHEVSTSKLDALGTSIDLLSADLTLERLTRVWSAMRTGSQRARLSRLQVESLEDHATFAGWGLSCQVSLANHKQKVKKKDKDQEKVRRTSRRTCNRTHTGHTEGKTEGHGQGQAEGAAERHGQGQGQTEGLPQWQ